MIKFARVSLSVCGVLYALLWVPSFDLYAAELALPVHPRGRLEINQVAVADEPINFILSSAQRIRHEITFERVIKVFGTVSSSTYRMPSDLKRSDVTEWFKQQIESLEGKIEFECQQRDCGRATIWATDIFQERVLSTSDANQNYLAVSIDIDDRQHLVMIYVVERGNRRVYAHVVEITPNQRITIDTPVDVVNELLSFGRVRLPAVVPDSLGSIPPETLDQLRELAQSELQALSEDEMYVVCHIYGSLSTEQLLEHSLLCAEQVVEVLKEQGLKVVPFGAGPLAPSEQTADSRIELVIPRLVRRETP